jgi:hypothetical protein
VAHLRKCGCMRINYTYNIGLCNAVHVCNAYMRVSVGRYYVICKSFPGNARGISLREERIFCLCVT